jgi:hypothetical protein
MASADFVRRLAAAGASILCGAAVLVGVATPANASPAGLVVVTGTSQNNSIDFKTVAAICPAGKKVIGGGVAALAISGASLVVTQAYPDGVGNQYIVAAWEDENRTSVNWQLTAYAICVDPLIGLEYVSTPVHTNVSGTWAFCPSGKVLVGMGGQVIGGNGEVALVGVFPVAGNPPRSETWASRDASGYAGNYQIRATSVCMTSVRGMSIDYPVKSLSNPVGGGVWVDCAAGKRVLSSGVRLANGGATVFHGEAKFSLMSPSLEAVTTYVAASPFGDSGLTFTAQAVSICA